MPREFKPKPAKPGSGLIGAAAEHYVMYRLLQMGMVAALAPVGAPIADIVVSDPDLRRIVSVQVKARRKLGSGGWVMKEKHEALVQPLLFYCFVQIPDVPTEAAKCWVVPSEVVADIVRVSHANWLKGSTEAKPRKDSGMRSFKPTYGMRHIGKPSGWLDQYSEAWSLIKEVATA